MTKPEQSRAAYSIKETQGNTIQIQAQFECSAPNISKVEIRAIQPPAPPFPKGWIGKLIELLNKWPWLKKLLIYLISIGYGLNVLGNVKAKEIAFGSNGKSDFETFDLQDVWLWKRGVGIFPVKWQWEYRVKPATQWQKFEESAHRIYVVLETPKKPWNQNYTGEFGRDNIQLPWTDALDKACFWAAGARTKDKAAALITKKINTHPNQSYTPVTIFGFITYYLSSYLQKLDAGNTFQLNCTDCANAVTTLSNLLGCNLVEGRFFNMKTRKFLTLNGNPSIQADWVSWNWGYHEICWLNKIGQNEFIYDGCLQVDMDNNYTDNVHIAHHPIKMRFGINDPQDYRYRLIESGEGNLENIPRHRPVA